MVGRYSQKLHSCWYSLSNVFAVFKNLTNDFNILVYSKNDFSLELFNLSEMKTETCLIGHKNTVFCIRYYIIKMKEYLISSSQDKSILIWNLLNYEIFLKLENLFNSPLIDSVLIYQNLEHILIISSVNDIDYIKVHDLNAGKFVKTLGNKEN